MLAAANRPTWHLPDYIRLPELSTPQQTGQTSSADEAAPVILTSCPGEYVSW